MQKPTQEEITDFLIKEKNYDEFTAAGFANQFWHFYESKGWKVGKNQMVSWKSAIVTWEVNKKKNETNNRTIAGSPKPGTSEARIERLKKW